MAKVLVVTEVTKVPVTDPVAADFIVEYIEQENTTFSGNYGVGDLKGAKVTVTAKIEDES